MARPCITNHAAFEVAAIDRRDRPVGLQDQPVALPVSPPHQFKVTLTYSVAQLDLSAQEIGEKHILISIRVGNGLNVVPGWPDPNRSIKRAGEDQVLPT